MLFRSHEREANIASRREELIGAIVGAMRCQIEPRRMMLAAAEALLAATDSHCVTVRPARSDVFASIGEMDDGARHEMEFDTTYQGKTNGRLSLSRNGLGPAYGETETALVEAVVPHLGVAIALAELLTATAKMPGQ